MLKHFSYFVVLTGLLMACSSVNKQARIDCQRADWFELGRRAGAQGQDGKDFEKLVRECKGTPSSLAKELFTNGHNSGLAEYCSPENAFAMGRGGLGYKDVCPQQLKLESMKNYKRGQHAQVIDQNIRKLSAQLDSLISRLKQKALPNTDQVILKKQISRLESQLQENKRQLNYIEKTSSASNSRARFITGS